MNSLRFENTKQALMLCSLLLVSNLANAQWELSKIETLTDEANRLKEQGLFESAYDLYPEIMFQIRIHEGLFSVRQLPMLMEMSAWHVSRGDFDQADNLLNRAEFYVGKNPDPIEGYRKLVVQRLYVPDEERCFERKKGGFLNSSQACDSLRYFRADTFIAATEIMIKTVEISDDRRTDLISLAKLAELTAFSVYDMYGATDTNYGYNSQSGVEYETEKTALQEKYQFQKWTSVHKRTLSQLKTEFEFEV